MNDDLAFVRSRIEGFGAYTDERTRADSDMRVRAFVGSRLSDAQARLAGTLDADTIKALDDVLFRCMFSDQVFIRKIEHARLDEATIAALVRCDRRLLEFAERLAAIAANDLRALLIEIDKQYEYRRAPQPIDA